jgi:hypothetical protein
MTRNLSSIPLICRRLNLLGVLCRLEFRLAALELSRLEGTLSSCLATLSTYWYAYHKLDIDVSAVNSGHNRTYSRVRLFCITGLIAV